MGVFMPIMFNSGAGSEGGATATKEDAIKEVERIASQKATEIFEARKDEFLRLEMEEKSTKDLIKSITAEVVKEMDLSKVEIEDSMGRKFALNKFVDDIQDQVDKLRVKAATINSGMEKQINQVIASMKQQFDANQDQLKAIYTNKNGVVSLIPKAVSPITTASFGDRVIIGLREPGVDYPRLPERFIFDYISTMTGGSGSNPLSWVELVNGSGAPGWQQGEGVEKDSMNWTYVEKKVSAEMIAVWTPVSRQALLNWPMLEQEIRFELTRRLLNVLDEAVINGDGTINTIYGIKYYANTFDAGSLAGTVVEANRGDVLRAAIGQVKKGAGTASSTIGGFTPNLIVVSQDTYTSMDLEKSSLNGQYLLPRFIDQEATRIKGVMIIASNFIADDEFIVGDFTRYLFNFVENLRIDVGYINAQFVQNLVTIRAELYGMGRVKNHEKPAFVKGDFTTAIAELTQGT